MGDKKPDMVINIVHIQGPLKGDIQEFEDSEIRIGRNFECQVRFPKDLLIVSRDHARILREGNRFKLINKSVNLTYLNGKAVSENEEAYLKSGDWLMFAEGGPKVSFLTKVAEGGQPLKPEKEPPASAMKAPEDPPAPMSTHKPSTQPPLSQPIPLLIRYGPTLQRFKNLPVTIGKSSECHFKIDQASLLNKHAEIFHKDGQYWVRDLTGTQSVFIDNEVIGSEAPLRPDCKLSLTEHGPAFRFIGDGRLDEISE